jgi:anti-sigma B factor antagonist/stage II sporulation protein AA (anti-sigma F factor antagonist)
VHIDTHHYADTIVAAPVGRIDHRSAVELETALAPLLAQAGASRGALVLDFSAVDYISSVGLRVLMIAAKQMRAQQASLSVAALQSVVAEIFTISRFDKVLVVCATLEQALAQGSAAALDAYRAAHPSSAP